MLERKVYRGQRTSGSASVTVNGRPLNPRYDLSNHSPDGFEWGYSGSGPAQLALAILADHLENDGLAQAHYQEFKSVIIAGLHEDQWSLTSDEVASALERISTPDLTRPS